MKIRYVIFYVRNIGKSKEFYERLGFKIKRDDGKFVSYGVEFKNQYFLIMETNEEKKVPGNQICVLGTGDIDSLYRKMIDQKVEIAKILQEASFGKTFAIRDINGNKIEFIQN